MRWEAGMEEFTFKVNIVAGVRVHAADAKAARGVVLDVLGAPALRNSDWPTRTTPRLGRPQP